MMRDNHLFLFQLIQILLFRKKMKRLIQTDEVKDSHILFIIKKGHLIFH